MNDIKKIDGEWLSEEECYRRYKDLVFMSLNTLIPIAKKEGIEPGDLIGEGNIGFMKAYRKFDENMGYKFSTYASRIIRFEALKFLQNNSKIVKYPRRTLELASKIKQHNLEESPEEEIANQLNVPLKDVEMAIASMVRTESLQAKKTEKKTVLEQVGIHTDFTQVYVKDFLESLKTTEKGVVCMLLEGDYSQKEIGKKFGFSQMQASRIIKRVRERYLEQEA